MTYLIKNILSLFCAAGAALLAFSFLSRPNPIEVEMPEVTPQMVQERRAELQQAAHQRQNAEAARKRSELEARMYQCVSGEDCVIVDKDPCGCLRGPEGVTAMNSNFSLEFSRLLEKEFAKATACPSVGSAERECSASAAPACVEGRCRIVY